MRLSCLLIVLCVVAISPGIHAQNSAGAAPATFDVTEKSIEDLQKAMQDKQITSRQLVELYLARIEAYDQRGPALNAIVAINPHARDDAAKLDAERAASGPRGPLHGIPVLVKDNYETVEMPTTAGSVALAAFHPRRDATLVRKLREAGAVILGKTTMHELAAGITTVGSSFGQTRNPYDLSRTPGGSSGGTGAAIAANFAAVGMGSDTCGSIRIPAANNNLVGLRGTQGLSSRAGIVPLSSSQDIGGPIARSIVDLAIVLDLTVGPDPGDPQTIRQGDGEDDDDDRPEYRRNLEADALKGARIGVVRSLFGTTPEDAEVTTILNRSIESMKKSGATVTDVVIPGLDDLLRDSSLIASDFKFDLMEYFAKSPDAPVSSLGEILERGLYHSELETTFRLRNEPETRETEATRRARIKQAALRYVTETVLDEQRLDVLLYPTLRRRPARIGDAQVGTNCSLSAHSGLPALSVPAGFTNDGVPIGMELLGPAWSEQALLSLGYSIEKLLDLRQPPFSTPALRDGKPPAPRRTTASGNGATVELVYDETTSRLRFTMTSSAKQPQTNAAIWLHSGTDDKVGAERHQLFNARASRTEGELVLSAADRRDLRDGRASLRFYPRGGGESVTIHLPEVRAWQ
jgi:amidase